MPSVTRSSQWRIHAQVVVAAAADLHSFEVVGDLARAELAGRALAARLDRQEPGEPVGGVDHARGVVVDDEPGRAHAAADRLETLVADGHIEAGRR